MKILVLDIGSSSVRALLFDEAARLIPDSEISLPHRLTTTPDGEATFDPLKIQQAVENCIDQVLQHPAADQIGAVGMATLAGNVLGVDRYNHPLTPIYTYGDTRSASDALLLRYQLKPGAVHQRTGCPIHTAYHPARFHWLRRTQRDLFESVAMWLDTGTFLYQTWFGSAPCSYSIASWSGLLNRATLTWDQDWLKMLHLREDQFPLLADYTDFQQGLQGAYAERWKPLRDVPFFLAVGDGAAANVGSGCVDQSKIALTVGTTAAIRMISEKQQAVPPGLWSYRVDASHHLIGGATSEGGNIFDWVQRTLRIDDLDAVEARLAKRPPDVHGLTFLPLLVGERSPGWAAHAKGAIYGLHLHTSAEDVLQAALEGVALRLGILAEHFPDQTPVVGSGGALYASSIWGQIIASALNRPIHLTDEPEITARGTAVLALRAIQNRSLDDFPPHISRIIEPQPDHVALLQKARQRQQALYAQVIGDDWQTLSK